MSGASVWAVSDTHLTTLEEHARMDTFSEQAATFSIDESPRPARQYAMAGYITLRLRVVLVGSSSCTKL